jgi:FixJ family two-component response regulator
MAAAQRLIAALTPREHEVMVRIIAGMLNKQVGGELGISDATVKIHRGRVMAKLRVASVAELVRLAGHAKGLVWE